MKITIFFIQSFLFFFFFGTSKNSDKLDFTFYLIIKTYHTRFARQKNVLLFIFVYKKKIYFNHDFDLRIISLLNYYQGKLVNKHFLCSADASLPLHSIIIIFDGFYNRKTKFLIIIFFYYQLKLLSCVKNMYRKSTIKKR
jgi:hypothetical protein